MGDSPFSVTRYENVYFFLKKCMASLSIPVHLDATHSYLSGKHRLLNYQLKQMQNCKPLWQIMGKLCSLNPMFHH